MRSRTFAGIITGWLLSRPDTIDTLRSWFQAEPDEGDRVLNFAARLAADWQEGYAVHNDDDSKETRMIKDLLARVHDRVDWISVARHLLKAYPLAVRLATPHGRLPSPAYVAASN